ncbi:hypothetical protein G7074_02145 [Pedobacter sp. HDW13]|uniref:glycosyltransferase family 39 protein n=1 Tax=unclassified Pedobacter TaxID=2628915 RepID=UPI000F5B7A68|nr:MULTISPECIES: glycosyltransferase family 39 protein [unclassified Pedobacter]QIL38180.1 hypothetical protein G7074_02145 [Pedobacter sp. HDW13]RQO64396.1 hypothetical protein DBR40_25565 [Pedobacter sp. KBW01]
MKLAAPIRLETIFPFLIILLVVTVTFSPVHMLGFASADDHWQLLHNPLVSNSPMDFSYWKTLIISYNRNQYSPFNTLCDNLIFRINQFDPYYYHLFSLLLHITNSILILVLSKKLLALFKQPENLYTPFLCAMIWAIHPLNVESVTWIAASKVLLFSFFTLASILTFINAIEQNSIKNYLLTFLFFLLSFLSKEQAVTTPVLLFALWISIKHHDEHIKFNPKLLWFICVFCLATLVFCLITIRANGVEISKMSRYPFHQRFFLAFYCLFFYLFNLIAPIGLHYHYPFPMKAGEALPAIYYAYSIIFLAICFSFLYKQKIKLNWLVIFCIAAALIELSLCIQIVPLTRPAIVADRYMYLPSFFLIFAIIYVVNNLVTNRKYRNILFSLTLLYIGFLACYSNQLTLQWIKNTIHSL